MKSSKPVKCKICEKKYVNKSALIAHIEKTHASSIPEGWNAARYENYLRTGKTEGQCVYCKQVTGWNDATGKYNRMCGSEACKKKARELANKNYIGLHGKPYSINDPEQQKKMVYGRKNSGTYIFEDEDTGKKYKAMYDSSYGKDFLEMIDTFLNWDGADIIAPSPHTYWYEYEGKKHFYIPDAYSTSLNLEIELKDGGDNPNKHPKIQSVDKIKEQKKDEVMKSLSKEVNYIKICNKDYSEFFALLSELKAKDVCKLPKWESKLDSVLESLNYEPVIEYVKTEKNAKNALFLKKEFKQTGSKLEKKETFNNEFDTRSLGGDSYDDVVATMLNNFDSEEMDKIINSENVVEAYNSYIDMNINRISKLDEHSDLYCQLDMIIQRNILILKNQYDFTDSEIRKYIVDNYFEHPDDPEKLKSTLQLRYNWNQRVMNLLKGMLTKNYMILGYTQQEAMQLVEDISSTNHIRRRIAIDELIANIAGNPEFVNGKSIDLRKIGGGIIYFSDEMFDEEHERYCDELLKHNIKRYETSTFTKSVISYAFRYDIVISAHGGYENIDDEDFDPTTDVTNDFDGDHTAKIIVDHYKKVANVYKRKFHKELELKELDERQSYIVNNGYTELFTNSYKSFEEFKKAKEILDQHKDDPETYNHLKEKYQYIVDDCNEYKRIMSEVSDMYLKKFGSFIYNTLTEEILNVLIVVDSKFYTSDFRYLIDSGYKSGRQWSMQRTAINGKYQSGEVQSVVATIKRVMKEHPEAHKIMVICCNGGHIELPDYMKNDRKHVIHVATDVRNVNYVDAYNMDAKRGYIRDTQKFLNESATNYVYESEEFEFDSILESVENNLKEFATENDVEYDDDYMLMESMSMIYSNEYPVTEGVIGNAWKAVVAFIKNMIKAIVGLFKAVINFFKNIFQKIKDFIRKLLGLPTINHDISYIAMESATVDKFKPKTNKDIDNKIRKSCEKMGKELQKISKSQTDTMNRIKQETEKVAREHVNESTILTESFDMYDSEKIRKYMADGNYEYASEYYKWANYNAPIKFGIPQCTSKSDIEEMVDKKCSKIYSDYWKFNRGTRANIYTPFKFYQTMKDPDVLNNLIIPNVSGLKRLRTKVYQYNFSKNSRRYSVILVADDTTVYKIQVLENKPITIMESTILTESYTTTNPKIQLILDMNKRLNQFEYGIPVNGVIKNIPGRQEYAKYYHHLSPKDFEKYNGGICWDYVEYQRNFLNKNGIKSTSYFIDDAGIDQTHTIIIVRIGDEFFYPESSFKNIRGVYKASNTMDILKFVVDKMGIENYHIQTYDNCKIYGAGCEKFINWIYDHGKFVAEGSSKGFCNRYNTPEKISEDDVLPENTAGMLESAINPSKHHYIISCFAGIGKNYVMDMLTNNGFSVANIDKLRDFYQLYPTPIDYTNHVNTMAKKYDVLFIPYFYQMEERYMQGSVDYVLVYPSKDQKAEYINRFKEIGFTTDQVNYLAENFDVMIHDCDTCKIPSKNKVRLKHGEYLSDYITDLTSTTESTLLIPTPYPENSSYIISPDTIVEENYVMNKNDLYIDYDKFESGTSNVLLITGLSGSGKSTLGESLAKKHKAEYIELDLFEHCYMFENDDQLKEAGEPFYKYLKSHKEMYEKLRNKSLRGNDLFEAISDFVPWCISHCNSDKNNKYVIEGVQIYSIYHKDASPIKRYPLVIKNTSALTSFVRMIRRDYGNGKDYKLSELIKDVPAALHWYITDEKTLNLFIKAVNESMIIESTKIKNPYKELLALDKNFYKRQVKLKKPVINYDDLVDYYRKKLFHTNLTKQEWYNLYKELTNAETYLKNVCNTENTENDKRMVFEAEKALKQIQSMVAYMEDQRRPVTEATVKNVPSMYFVSGISMDDELLKPGVPQNFLTKHGYEDNKTPRICFAPSVDKCLIALSQNLQGKELYVHVPEEGDLNPKYIYHPTKEEVPDCKITGEIWYKHQINLRLIGKIKVLKATDDEYDYTYGDKTATLYGWNWKWIWKTDKDGNNIPVTEIVMKSSIDKDYQSKGKKNLNSFKKVALKKELIDRLKNDYKMLRSVRPEGENYAFFDNDNLVAYICTSKERDGLIWITALEVLPEYRGYGLSNQLLDFATKSLHAEALGVAKDNEVAMSIYKKYGFKISPESEKEVKTGKVNNYRMYYGITKMESVISITEDTIMEACKNPAIARKFCDDVRKLAKKYNANFYLVTDGASATSNNGNPAVKVARDAVAKWERNNGFDDKEDWSNNPNDFNNYYLKESTIVDFNALLEIPIVESNLQSEMRHDISLGNGYYKHDDEKRHEIYKVINGKKIGSIKYWEPYGELFNFDVDEEYRGKGYGTKLIDLAIKEYDPVRIAVRKDNKLAYDMYRRRGFKEFTTFKNPDDNNSENWYMKRVPKDPSKVLESTYIEASKDTTKYYPVFIFLSYTGTNMAKLIKAFTHDPYAHSSISFDTDLNHMVSFNRDGMVIEDIQKSVYAKNKNNIRYSLYMYMATGEEYESMRNFVNELLGRKSKLRYNMLGLTNFVFGRGSSKEDKFFCSEFVASVINAGNNKLIKTKPYMTTPYMLAKNKNFIFIKTGLLSHYDPKVIDKIVEEKIEERGWEDVIIK